MTDLVQALAATIARGLQHHQAGQIELAEQLYREVLSADPRNAAALGLLGAAHLQRGQFHEAEPLLRQALELKPEQAPTHDNLGVALVKLGRLDEAVASFRRAIELNPRHAETFANLGNALLKLNQPGEAAGALDQARRLKPDSGQIRYELGNAFMALCRYDDAARELGEAVRLKPGHAEAHNNLGSALNKLDRLDEAVACFHEALRLKPGYAMARNNLGVVFTELGQFDEAVALFDELLQADGAFALAHNNRGIALMKHGKLAKALECFERAIELNADYPAAHRNRAVAWLTLGQFEQGWPEFLWRWKCKDYPAHGYAQPLWDGGPLDGRTILLHAEQGLGDTLQFIRFAPLVKRQGGRVVVRCPTSLAPLLARSPGIDQMARDDAEMPPIDCRAALMDLPALCRTRLDTIPRHVPYLFTDPRLVEHWHGRLATEPGFTIGITWQGNPQYRGDRFRSIPLARFAPVAAIPGVRLVSLQKGPGVEQLAAAGFPVDDLGSGLDEGCGAFVETAAVMQNLDLVISSDTATAHLAGALGVPVWVALQVSPEWRWMFDRDDCPWYPSMRLFRQRTWGDWDDVFLSMAEALRERLTQAQA